MESLEEVVESPTKPCGTPGNERLELPREIGVRRMGYYGFLSCKEQHSWQVDLPDDMIRSVTVVHLGQVHALVRLDDTILDQYRWNSGTPISHDSPPVFEFTVVRYRAQLATQSGWIDNQTRLYVNDQLIA